MWVVLWIASWGTFAVALVWLHVTPRYIHPDAALLLRAILYLLLMAGVIFMVPALQQLNDTL